MNLFMAINDKELVLPEPVINHCTTTYVPFNPMTEYGYLVCDHPKDLSYFTCLAKGIPLNTIATLDDQYDERRFYLIRQDGLVIVRTLKGGDKPNLFKEKVNVFSLDMGIKMGITENPRVSDFVDMCFKKGMSSEETIDFMKRNGCHNREYNVVKYSKLKKKLEKKDMGLKHLPVPLTRFSTAAE